MRLDNQETKQKMVQRLRRVEGQIRGVQTMLEEERDCREIMQQLAAVNSAVKSASRVFFREYAAACMAEMGGEEPSAVKRDRMVQEMIALLDKTP